MRTRSVSVAALSVSESAVNTPGAPGAPGAGALNTPLLAQMSHLLSHEQHASRDDLEEADEEDVFQRMVDRLGREAPAHTSWQHVLGVFDDEDSVTGFGLLAHDPVLQYQPGGMRRGSLPVLTGAPAAAAAASPDGERHTLPLCLFGESF